MRPLEPPLDPQLGSAPHWEHLPHGADIGVRGVGGSPAAAFEQGALALTAAVCDPTCVEQRDSVAIHCKAPDLELLFVEWLNALVFEMATGGLLFSRFQVAIEDMRLKGMAWGETVEVARHRPAAEIKGATYTALRVAEIAPGTWVAQCVVDV